MASVSYALVFPGQAAEVPNIDALRAFDVFSSYSNVVSNFLRVDIVDPQARSILSKNLLTSALAVLASAVSLDLLKNSRELAATEPVGLAGFSVGSWTALYAAGVLSFEQLIRLICARADFMDQCVRLTPGGMVAVIGLSEQVVESLCSESRNAGRYAAIANYNAVGQYTISFAEEARFSILKRLAELRAKRIVELSVAGPWHSELMSPAASKFLEFLDSETLKPPRNPVADNVSGNLFPPCGVLDKNVLAIQVSKPVRWYDDVSSLVDLRPQEIIEVGYGGVLTKFGFFINRKVKHRSFFHPRALS